MNRFTRFFLISQIALLSLSAACGGASAIELDYKENKSGFSVTLKGTKDTDSTELSVNGGESYFKIDPKGITFKKAKPGDYQLCARKTGDTKTAQPVKTMHIAPDSASKIKISVSTSPEVRFGEGSITVSIDNFQENGKYFVSTDGGRTWTPMSKKSIRLTGCRSGYYKVLVASRVKDGGCSDIVKTYVGRRPQQDSAYVSLDPLLQSPELPTGCEVTSLTMVINSLGFPVKKEVLSDHFLEKGAVHTVSYRRKFVGDPRTKYSYGCYAPVIEKCAHSFLDNIKGRKFRIVNLTGSSLDDLLRCVDMGCPVIVWATIDMRAPFYTKQWKDMQTGETVRWLAEEHCLVITGYDRKKNTITVNDPLKGRTSYDLTLFNTRYDQLEKQAIVITEEKSRN